VWRLSYDIKRYNGKICVNISLIPASGSSKWALPFEFISISHPRNACCIFYRVFLHPKNIKWKEKLLELLKKGKVVPVLNYLSTMPWRHMGKWRYSSTIPNFGTRWRWVVSFMPLSLYPRYQLDNRLGGPQSRSGCCGGEKNLALPGIGPRTSSPSPVAILTELSRLPVMQFLPCSCYFLSLRP
jgi:hypothetical protein